MKLYTRTGDDGSTGLFGGARVRKDHVRIEAYGTVDELNGLLGLALAACTGEDDGSRHLLELLGPIQSRLFDLGADLATPADSPHADKVRRLAETEVAELENLIDDIDGRNDEIRAFVMPGGSELAARLHVARGACRRSERAIVSLADVDEVNPATIRFMNRLSDLLFASARFANKSLGIADVPWVARSPTGSEG
ncbi:MAG: cob(I)yrinic acid a,c-diamide adenosyltransferase [Phycisphaerales bacterium]|nr:cob(I)yrinic acid a,c-diamide adenosyltransferase [Phycisphaerales bacterium]